MVDDARYRQKVFLETYIDQNNIVKDDGETQAGVEFMYWEPNYPLVQEFKAPSVVHGIYAIGTPESEASRSGDLIIRRYHERVPIVLITMDRTGVTGTLLNWSMNEELRSICEAHSTGSQRNLERGRNLDLDLGTTKLYQRETIMDYWRGTT